MDVSNKKIMAWFVVISIAYINLSNISCLADDITIFTPRNTAIVAYRSNEMDQEAKEQTDLAYARIIDDNRWQAVIKSSSSNQYNSHGYAWRVYAGGEAVIIDDKDVANFWRDGSYRPIKRHEAVRGDIIVMSDPHAPDQLHSAVVINAKWCMSKWGDGPLVLHRLNDHPYGRTYRYYTRVKVAAPTGLTIVTDR